MGVRQVQPFSGVIDYMATNVVTAVFGASRVVKTRALYQWDYGQVLQFEGLDLPDAYTVHFSNQGIQGTAKTQVGNADGVSIPDEYLTSGQTVYAWVYLHAGEDDGETMYAVILPVTARPQPTEDEPTPVQQGVIDQAIAALNTAVTQTAADVQTTGEAVTAAQAAQEAAEIAQTATESAAGQADASADAAAQSVAQAAQSAASASVYASNAIGSAASAAADAAAAAEARADAQTEAAAASESANNARDAAQAADDASQAIQGMGVTANTLPSGSEATVSKTVDPQTGAVTLDFGIPQGGPGTPGSDGISPTITITDIPGGHRVTITDADGAHSFDVMDGAGGGAVQDVQVNGVSVLTDGVANVPVAGAGKFGAVMVSGYGLSMQSNGYISTKAATPAEVKSGTRSWEHIAPGIQHTSTFYGLAKAAGSDEHDSTLPVGQYTESAKSAISTMLSGSVSVSGTTPTITALPGIRYVCGEVSTLDITLPASGIVDVVFESGSTPTVLTVTPPTGVTVRWANGFDPDNLDADTTYEINIADGLGVAASWT